MQAILDIPDEALTEMRSRSKTAGDIPIHAVVKWSPDGVPYAHFISFVQIPTEGLSVSPFHAEASARQRASAPEQQSGHRKAKSISEPLEEIRKRWPWAGIAADGIRHDVSHDWADIQRSIEEGWAEDFAEKERRLFAECGGK